MNERSKTSGKPWVDPDDAPEITQSWVREADLHEGGQLVRRGRPKADKTKEAVKLRLDADVLAALRATGDGWQTRINEMLRATLRLARKL